MTAFRLWVTRAPSDSRLFGHHSIRMFLAGGISGCPEWQVQAIEMLKTFELPLAFDYDGSAVPVKVNDLEVFDPRRDEWGELGEKGIREQITWEHRRLELADAHLFWFPCETLCPITLFELGKVAQWGRKLFVGCHPDYKRKLDVETQLGLIRSDVTVRSDLTTVVMDAVKCVMEDFE